MHQSIPVIKRVAPTIWWLANSTSYIVVAELFGMGVSTVAEVVVQVCLAMEKDLVRRTVYLGDMNTMSAFLGGGG